MELTTEPPTTDTDVFDVPVATDTPTEAPADTPTDTPTYTSEAPAEAPTEAPADTTSTPTPEALAAERATILATFNTTVGDLVDELKGTFPELKESLDERYSVAVAPDDPSLLQWFETNAQPHFMRLTTKDDALFKEHDTTFLLPDINFSQLWKCKLTKATKGAIWKYLHVLLLLVSRYQLDTHDFESTFAKWNEMLDGSKMDEAEMQRMKTHAEQMMQLMQGLAAGDDEADDDEHAVGGDGGDADGDADTNGATGDEKAKRFEEELKQDPFIQQLENSKIAKFAQELSSEIDVSSLGLAPDAKVESFQDVFGLIGQNPQRLMGLVKSVGDKIQHKMSSGDIQQSELVEEAHTLVKSMQDSKAFKQMFKKARKRGGKSGGGGGAGGLDPQAMFAMMAKQMASMPGMEGMMGGAGGPGGPDGPGGAGGMPDPAAMQAMMAQMMGGMGGMGAGGGANALARAETQDRLRRKLAVKQEGEAAVEGTGGGGAGSGTGGAGSGVGGGKKKRRGKKKKKVPNPTASSGAN